MAEAGPKTLESLAAALGKGKYPPVEKWDPPFCGDLDMRIATDGTWFYLGTPIGRPALVRLFSTVIKREGERYFLVTPVEKVGIRVEDAPFLAVEMEIENRGPAQNPCGWQTFYVHWTLRCITNRAGSSGNRGPGRFQESATCKTSITSLEELAFLSLNMKTTLAPPRNI